MQAQIEALSTELEELRAMRPDGNWNQRNTTLGGWARTVEIRRVGKVVL